MTACMAFLRPCVRPAPSSWAWGAGDHTGCRRLLLSRIHAAAGGGSTGGGSTGGARVVLKLHKQLSFGQELALLSDEHNWSIDNAVRLTWTEGDVWTCSLTTAGAQVTYKYAIVDGSNEVLEWQPGENRVLSVPDAPAEVLESWHGGERSITPLLAPEGAATGEASPAPVEAEAPSAQVNAEHAAPAGMNSASESHSDMHAAPGEHAERPAAAPRATEPVGVATQPVLADSLGAGRSTGTASAPSTQPDAHGERPGDAEEGGARAAPKRGRRGASAGQAPPVLSGDGAWTEQALSSLTLAELRALGKVRGVRGLSGLKKADVVRRLAEAGGGGSGGAGGEA